MDISPSNAAVGFRQPGERSADMRAQQSAQVHADAERITIQLQRNAAAEVKLEIQVPGRFVIDAGVEAVVTHEIRSARGNAGSGEALAVCRFATSRTFRRGTAAENAAGHGLISPRRNVISRRRKTEFAWIVFDAAVKLCVVAEGDERAMKIFCVQDGVARAEIEERRKISEGVVDVIRQIPGGVTGAEPLLRVAGWSCKMQGRTEIQQGGRVVLPDVGE